MRLFTALWPSEESRRHLAAAIGAARARAEVARAAGDLRKFRWTPPERWHVTLCFHGDGADPERVARRLTRRVARLSAGDPGWNAPNLRLAGAGRFRGVLWVGVEPAGEADAAGLRRLAKAAGADPRSYVAHLTVARWASGRADAALAAPLTDYAGPWWQARELAVVRSEHEHGRPTYRTLERVPCRSAVDTPAPGSRGDGRPC